jgi:hypothetical protein
MMSLEPATPSQIEDFPALIAHQATAFPATKIKDYRARHVHRNLPQLFSQSDRTGQGR